MLRTTRLQRPSRRFSTKIPKEFERFRNVPIQKSALFGLFSMISLTTLDKNKVNSNDEIISYLQTLEDKEQCFHLAIKNRDLTLFKRLLTETYPHSENVANLEEGLIGTALSYRWDEAAKLLVTPPFSLFGLNLKRWKFNANKGIIHTLNTPEPHIQQHALQRYYELHPPLFKEMDFVAYATKRNCGNDIIHLLHKYSR
jgi:uncharacterized protein YcgL (UPF0745 family)